MLGVKIIALDQVLIGNICHAEEVQKTKVCALCFSCMYAGLQKRYGSLDDSTGGGFVGKLGGCSDYLEN